MTGAVRGNAGQVPVITIDGPTASGKGTIAHRVAQALGWSMLDSGALYRLTALAAREQGIAMEDVAALARVAADLAVHFENGRVYLQARDVSLAIREEDIGRRASQLAVHPPVREALLQCQRDFRRPPGLVADGRDMGTVVFPDAPLKIFLVASAAARAQRRCKQLSEQGISAKLATLVEEMRLRDERDRQRAHAPLVAAAGAYTIDSSDLSIDETVARVLDLWSGTHSVPDEGAAT
ncbi:MAG: (d)CMP kinase [Castellaniella sp.]